MIRRIGEPRSGRRAASAPSPAQRLRGALLIGSLLVAGLAAPAQAEPRRWVPLAGKSRVAFDASFPLGNFTGATEDLAGTFHADPDDLREPVKGALTVKAGSLRTGVAERDRDVWKALAVERYPEIRFAVERVEASFPSVTDRADVLLTVTGRMEIRGVERPVVFPGRVRLQEGKLWVRGETMLQLSAFGIPPPRRLLFFSVRDDLLVRFDVLLTRAE